MTKEREKELKESKEYYLELMGDRMELAKTRLLNGYYQLEIILSKEIGTKDLKSYAKSIEILNKLRNDFFDIYCEKEFFKHKYAEERTKK